MRRGGSSACVDAVEQQRAVGEAGERVVERAVAELVVAVAQRVGHRVEVAGATRSAITERGDERGHAPARLAGAIATRSAGELRREHQRETRDAQPSLDTTSRELERLGEIRGVSLPGAAHAWRSGIGSTGCEASDEYQPLGQISKCRCGAVASPVCPTWPITWPALTVVALVDRDRAVEQVHEDEVAAVVGVDHDVVAGALRLVRAPVTTPRAG